MLGYLWYPVFYVINFWENQYIFNVPKHFIIEELARFLSRGYT